MKDKKFTIEHIIIIGENYPDKIKIEAIKSKINLKWSTQINLLSDNVQLFKSEPKFKSSKKAIEYGEGFSKWCNGYVKENEVFDLDVEE